jgi:hypothetical protein
MSFWTLSTGQLPSGSAEASHAKDFGLIPNGTQSPALIKEFLLMEPTEYYDREFYQVSFKLTSGDFAGREVRLNIYPFDAKESSSDRGVNLLKRIYDLCGHKPSHANKPSTVDLQPMVGKILGIKIKEWINEKKLNKDGLPMQGNSVSEVHKADKDFETVTGTKLEVTGYPSQKSSPIGPKDPLTGLPLDDSGIPF